MSKHIVLLGDSTFDNKLYCEGGPAVEDHLRRSLPEGWTVTVCAADGALTSEIDSQLAQVPPQATHLFLAMGGNDGLHRLAFLRQEAASILDALDQLHDPLEELEGRYATTVDRVRALGLPLTLCCLYNGCFPADKAKAIRTAVRLYNNIIMRTAVARDLAIIDMSAVCTEPSDYFNPIEPSCAGGAKIARAVRDRLSLLS